MTPKCENTDCNDLYGPEDERAHCLAQVLLMLHYVAKFTTGDREALVCAARDMLLHERAAARAAGVADALAHVQSRIETTPVQGPDTK